MTVPARTQSATITSSQIADFNRDGAILLSNVLEDRWVQMLAQGLEFANDHPDGMSAGVSMPLRIDQFPASHSPKLKQLLDNSPIAEIVGSMLNAPVRFYMDQMFYKPAGAHRAKRVAPRHVLLQCRRPSINTCMGLCRPCATQYKP
jgi:hypothetical protein